MRHYHFKSIFLAKLQMHNPSKFNNFTFPGYNILRFRTLVVTWDVSLRCQNLCETSLKRLIFTYDLEVILKCLFT